MTQKSNLIKQKKILYLINKYKKKENLFFFKYIAVIMLNH